MAILVSLFGALGRFAGKIVNAALGWASILLFGRVPQSKQILLSAVSLGSIAWVVALLGSILPDLGAFLLAAVPVPKFIDRNLVRLAMIVAIFVLPILVGIAALFLVPKEERPSGIGGKIGAVLHGFIFCPVLAIMLVFLAVIALSRKGRAMVKHWEDAHVAIVVKPGHYDGVVDSLRQALDKADLQLASEPAPTVLAAPAHILAAVSGPGVKNMVPDRLMELKSRTLEILVYPSDISIAGSKQEVARARAAVASRLTTAPAYLTTSEESQKVEDRIEKIGSQVQQAQTGTPGADRDARRELDDIDKTLANLVVPYDEWEVLYRMRLQVERELLTGEKPGETLATGAAEAAGAQPAASKRQGVGAAAAQRSGGQRGQGRRTSQGLVGLTVGSAASLAGFALIALDVALAVADRVAPPKGRARLPRLRR